MRHFIPVWGAIMTPNERCSHSDSNWLGNSSDARAYGISCVAKVVGMLGARQNHKIVHQVPPSRAKFQCRAMYQGQLPFSCLILNIWGSYLPPNWVLYRKSWCSHFCALAFSACVFTRVRARVFYTIIIRDQALLGDPMVWRLSWHGVCTFKIMDRSAWNKFS